MLFYAHSGVRYLILLAGAVTLVYGLYVLATGRRYDDVLRRSASTYTLLLHVQILLGLALVFSGRFYPQLTGHIFMMVFAAAAMQIPVSVLRRREPERRTAAPLVVGALLSLGLIVGGILAIGRPIVGSGGG
ncbi:MAG: hypothetical protein D6701_00660 [Gemmatimonadetes bacterium]|nr:MAG: hypothetical protein D6701_00660 [Gemmatimonadota bacterium]